MAEPAAGATAASVPSLASPAVGNAAANAHADDEVAEEREVRVCFSQSFSFSFHCLCAVCGDHETVAQQADMAFTTMSRWLTCVDHFVSTFLLAFSSLSATSRRSAARSAGSEDEAASHGSRPPVGLSQSKSDPKTPFDCVLVWRCFITTLTILFTMRAAAWCTCSAAQRTSGARARRGSSAATARRWRFSSAAGTRAVAATLAGSLARSGGCSTRHS